MDCQTAIVTYPAGDLNFKYFIVGDDYSVIHNENVNRIGHEMYYKTVQISKNAYVSIIGKTVQLIDSTTDRVVKQTTLTRDAISLHFNCNLLVFVSKNKKTEHPLSIWRVDNSLNLTHVKDLTIGAYEGLLELDEQFIAVTTLNRSSTLNFISMKTFKVERSLSSRAKHLEYHRGYLFVLKKLNLVGILEVASGTFLRDISIEGIELPTERSYTTTSYFTDSV
jgi:hypothetical protein